MKDDNGWISVNDKMPESTGRVFLSDGFDVGEGVYIKYVKGGGRWGRGIDGATHWQPLPPLPKLSK